MLSKMTTIKNLRYAVVNTDQLDLFQADDYLLAPTSTNFHTMEAQSAQTGIAVRKRK